MALKDGTKVQVEYTGTLDDGTMFDTNVGKDALEFTVGEHQVIKGFEDAVQGMKKGEEKTIKISPKEGYGEHHKELLKELPKHLFPESEKLQVGARLGLQSKDGQRLVASVAAIGAETITLDLNHPLAGKTLTFKIKLMSHE